jgi:hypothetical protein
MMRTHALAGFVVLALAGTAASEPPDLSKLPKPQKEHEWLQQLVGDWETDVEMYLEPGKPPLKGKGTEKAQSLGGFWIVEEFSCTFMGTPMKGIITLGYDPEKKKYVGTAVDSMTSHMWKYEGVVDSTGKVLTLETSGPCPREPGKTFKFKETIEFKSKDERVFTSMMQEADGKWTTAVIMNARRK